MTRIYLVAIAGLAGSFFGLQPVQAYQAPRGGDRTRPR